MTALSNAPVLKTELFSYSLNLDIDEQAQEYARITEKLKSQDIKLMRVYSLNDRSVSTGTVFLECRCVFDNQWNTASDSPVNPDRRVFDWYETIVPNNRIRIGHYLEITDEIRQLRVDVLKCGFCGNHEWKSSGQVFCSACLGSEYLSESELHLTRLMPCSTGFPKREKLSVDESSELLPKYVFRQTESQGKLQKIRAANDRKRITEKCEQAIAERDGFLWLLDRDIPLENCIFYGGKKGFTFGWRSSMGEATKEVLLPKLEGFPFIYTIQ